MLDLREMLNLMKFCEKCCCCFGIVFIASSSAWAGPKGIVQVPTVPSAGITIDGDFSDWDLARYTTVSRQPVFPDALDNESTDALGDHLVWEVDRVGGFNGTFPDELDPQNPSEFGSTIYFSYDQQFLYVLGVFIDDTLQGSRDPGGFDNFNNDGFEIFIDAKGDSDDPADEAAFPAFDTEQDAIDLGVTANTDDFQLTVGLNDFFEPDNAGPNDRGARQHLERGGDPDIVKPLYNEEVLEGMDLSAVGGLSIAAKEYADLGAAGALNPEIVASPDTTFEGYAVELVIPFGVTDGFSPDHSMGFDLFWRDVDDPDDPEPGFGGGAIMWTDWVQNTNVPSDVDAGTGLFHTATWGQLEFLTGLTGDFNGDGKLDIEDIDDLTRKSAGGTNPSSHDLNADSLVNDADVTVWIDDLFNSWLGDANLDGEFNSSDLVTVLASGTYEADVDAVWSSGDFNGDGRSNSGDLVVALAGGGYENGPRAAVASVPEPSAMSLLLLGLLATIRRRRE